MNIVDVLIIIFIAFGFVLGFKRGFTRQLVYLVGIVAIIALAYLFKNPVSIFLYTNLPFIKFGGILKDITVLNILFYEVLAFIISFVILYILLRLLLNITKIFEKLLKATIILSIPSKILGGILGIIQSIIYVFIILYFLNVPMINIKEVKDSKVGNIILEKTPLLNNVCDKSIEVYKEIIELKDEYVKTDDVKKFNQKTLDTMIKNGVISRENALKLKKQGKLKNIDIK